MQSSGAFSIAVCSRSPKNQDRPPIVLCPHGANSAQHMSEITNSQAGRASPIGEAGMLGILLYLSVCAQSTFSGSQLSKDGPVPDAETVGDPGGIRPYNIGSIGC